MVGGTGQDVVAAAAAAHTVEDVAELLRELRRRHARQRRDSRLTYRELAARTGWSQSAIGEYFAGQTLPPTDRLDALAALLGATAGEQGALGSARDRVEETLRGAASPPGKAAGTPVAWQLPADVFGFAGRTSELARLDALIGQAGQTPAVLISVSGPAGVGKSALAVHWAHRVADRFSDGQLYINLRGFDPTGSPMTPAEAVRRFLDAFQVPAQRIPVDLDAQAALYRTLLAGRKMLILLDNARDPSQIRPLLPGAPGCLVLVTSRDQLPGLVATDGAYPVSLGLPSPAEAGDLLARRLGPDRVAAEPEAVEAIITACARLPLALSIVAARAATHPQLSLTALAGELHERHHRLDALTTGEAATDIKAVFSWSYHTLTPGAAGLFRLLGLHPGPDISAPAAASLAGLPPAKVRPVLTELTRANLLMEHTSGRYTLHDLLRVYATHLARSIDLDRQHHAAIHRILDHYLHTAHTAALRLNPQRDPIELPGTQPGVTVEELTDHAHAMAWFRSEHAVLLSVVGHCDDAAFDTRTWQLAWTMWDYFERHGHWHDWVLTYRTAAAAAARRADRAGQAHAHRGLGCAYARLGRSSSAYQHLTQAIDLFHDVADLTGQARAEHDFAIVLERQGRHTEALSHAERALQLYRACGHRPGQARVLNGIGWHHALLGDYQQTVVYCGQSLALLQNVDDRSGEAATWDSLGYAYHHLGHHVWAIACFRHAIDLFGDLGHRYEEATSLSHLGDTHHTTGNPTAACHSWQHALTILTDLDHPDTDQIRTKLADLDLNSTALKRTPSGRNRTEHDGVTTRP